MSTMMNGKMYKILVPIKGKDNETTHWARLGSAFTNKDGSLNCYVDAIPVQAFGGKELMLQIRELSEEDLRRRDERKSTNGDASSSFTPHQPRLDTVPF
jgi:hypothetical protein